MKLIDVTVVNYLPTGVAFGLTEPCGEQVYIPSIIFPNGPEEKVGETCRMLVAENDHERANLTNRRQTPWKALRLVPERGPDNPPNIETPPVDFGPPDEVDPPKDNRSVAEIEVERTLRPDVLLSTMKITELSGVRSGDRLTTVSLVRNILLRMQQNGDAACVKIFTGRNTKRASEVLWTSDPDLIKEMVEEYGKEPKT
jgi:hypothetical protein